jgi:hypothetical protein
MPEECSDPQRKAMLSAVRAAVNQTRQSLESRAE